MMDSAQAELATISAKNVSDFELPFEINLANIGASISAKRIGVNVLRRLRSKRSKVPGHWYDPRNRVMTKRDTAVPETTDSHAGLVLHNIIP